jgi:hypothetical protein
MVGENNRETPALSLESMCHNIPQQEKLPAVPERRSVEEILASAPVVSAEQALFQLCWALLEVEAA